MENPRACYEPAHADARLLDRGSSKTKPRSGGNQPAHESLLNRRLSALSPAVDVVQKHSAWAEPECRCLLKPLDGEHVVPTSSRAVAEYLSVLNDAAFSGATPVEPKVISPTDPAARYTASANSVAGYAYSDNYLIDLKHAVIMDVEATTTVRQAEVGAAKTMLDRTAEQFEVAPSRLVADAGYGSAEMIGWLVDERGIEPHVKLMDKSERTDGTFSREPTSPSIHRATSMSVPLAKS